MTCLRYSPQLLLHVMENNHLNYQLGMKNNVSELQLRQVA